MNKTYFLMFFTALEPSSVIEILVVLDNNILFILSFGLFLYFEFVFA